MLPNGIAEDMRLRFDAPERNRRKIRDSGLMLSNGIAEDTRLRVDAPERNRRKIRDSGLMLPNGIVDFQNWILILATIDLLILFRNKGLFGNTFDFLL